MKPCKKKNMDKIQKNVLPINLQDALVQPMVDPLDVHVYFLYLLHSLLLYVALPLYEPPLSCTAPVIYGWNEIKAVYLIEN